MSNNLQAIYRIKRPQEEVVKQLTTTGKVKIEQVQSNLPEKTGYDGIWNKDMVWNIELTDVIETAQLIYGKPVEVELWITDEVMEG